MNTRRLFFVTTLLCAGVLAGCASPYVGGSDYSLSEARSASSVIFGYVISSRPVTLRPKDTGLGAAGGTAAGATLGNLAGHGVGNVVYTVFFGLAGAVIGNKVEQGSGKQPGVEVLVRLDRGTFISVVQGLDQGVSFKPGQRVALTKDGQTIRVEPFLAQY